MRFFKAFNLLHRRTKSATFVSGTVPVRTSFGSRDRNQPGSPIATHYNPLVFDIATPQSGPTSSYFNYHLHTDPRVMSSNFTQHHIHRGGYPMERPSHLSMDPRAMTHQEQVSLYWYQEHAKARESLEHCLRDLNAERRKITALEAKVAQDANTIDDLRKELERYKGYIDGINLTMRGQRGGSESIQQLLNLPTVDAIAEFALSSQIRTLEDYSAALRMTLTTRRQLRDQRKLTKYWKNKTRDSVSLAAAEGIPVIQPITPSVSAISSVDEALPKERQVALDRLIARRGLTSTLAYLNEDISIDAPSNTLVLDSDSDNEKVASSSQNILSSFPSRSSSALSKSASRLGPLASESFRAQVDEFFGIRKSINGKSPASHSSRSSHSSQRSLSDLSNLPPALPSSTNASWMKAALSMNSTQSFKIESFGDLGVLFRTAFGEAPSGDVFSSQFAQSAITQSSMNIRPLSIHGTSSNDLQQGPTGKKSRRASTSTSVSQSSWKRYAEDNGSQQDLQPALEQEYPGKKKGLTRKNATNGSTGFSFPFFRKRTSAESSSKKSTGSSGQHDLEIEIYAI